MGQYGSVIFSGVRNGGGIDNTRQGGIPEGTDNLVEVLVDLGELGRELLVLEVYTLLVENLCYIGDELQPVINGEKLQTGEARGFKPVRCLRLTRLHYLRFPQSSLTWHRQIQNASKIQCMLYF